MSCFPSKVLLMKTDNALQLRMIIASSSRFHLLLKYFHLCCFISFACKDIGGLVGLLRVFVITDFGCKLKVSYLNKHVIYNEEEVDSLRGHDKDVEAPS